MKKVLALVTAAALSVLSLECASLEITYATEETITQTQSSFDENAHGKVIDSYNCGKEEDVSSVKYTLYEDGVMYISGTGTVTVTGIVPVCEKYRNILQVIIEEGVTSIGNYAFSGCSGLTSIEIPSGSPAASPVNTPTTTPTTSPSGTPGATTKPQKKGDVNGDGNIDLADVQIVLKTSLKINDMNPGQEEFYNINGDNNVDLQDVAMLLKVALKLIEI